MRDGDNGEVQSLKCLFNVLETGIKSQGASTDTIKKCISAFTMLSKEEIALQHDSDEIDDLFSQQKQCLLTIVKANLTSMQQSSDDSLSTEEVLDIA